MTIEAMKQALEALEKLWDIIDDIDTYGDMAKSDDKLYRSLVERRQRQRFEQTGISTDGYELNGGAITSLRQAIEQAEKPFYKVEGPLHVVCQCDKCKTEKQEPVGVVGMDVSRPHMRSLDGQYFGQKPDTKTVMLFKDLEVGTKLYTTPQPQQAQKQEPWVWQQSPIKTQWGDDMVVADLAIDKDHTVSVYCERDQTARVEAMFKGKTT
jgi:hypothetical protein